MIYQIYGFNLKCDYYIDYLKNYIRTNLDSTLPTIDISTVFNLANDVIAAAELQNDDVHAYFSPTKLTCN